MSLSLNSTQLEILKLFRNDQPEEELEEIKSLLIAYLSARVVAEADSAFDKKSYSASIFEKWKSEHFRKTA